MNNLKSNILVLISLTLINLNTYAYAFAFESIRNSSIYNYSQNNNPKPKYGFVIYDDTLASSFWVGEWAKANFQNNEKIKSGTFAIRVDYKGDDGLQIGGINEDLSKYTTLNASLYSDEGTSVSIIINEQWNNGQVFYIPPKKWTNISVPITNIANGTTKLDQFVIRDNSLKPNTLFVDQIGLDVILDPSNPSANNTPKVELAYEIYTENNLNAPWIGDWSKPELNNTEKPYSGQYAIKVALNTETGLQLAGTNIDLKNYSTIKFAVYSTKNTQIKLALNEQWDGYMFNLNANQWVEVEIPLKEVLYGTKQYTQLAIQNIGVYDIDLFVDNIGFN